MTETNGQEKEPRIVGYKARLIGAPQIGVWQPPSRAEVEALPPLRSPSPRGWQIDEPEEQIRTQPEGETAPGGEPSAEREAEDLAAPRPPAALALPEGIEEGSAPAFIGRRVQDAAKLVRTMLIEESAGYENAAQTASSVQAKEGQPEEELPMLQQVAILFVALGQEISGEIMKCLNDFEIEEITMAIANLKNVARQVQDQVVEKFKQHLLAGKWLSQGGMDFARRALERAVGPQKAREILDRVTNTVSSGFYMLKNVAPDQVAPFISNEHPQTIALILSQLEPAQAAGILSQLPERMQPDVIYRITTMENVTPAVLRDIEESLEANLRDILGGDQDVGGPKVAADMLNMSGSSVEKNVLDSMDKDDPESAEGVRNLMFVFADIAALSDRDIQTLMREIDQKDLTIALKAAVERVKEKVLGNFSSEKRAELTEAMEVLGPMRLSEVEEVQLRLVQQVRQLEEQGKVTIVRGDSDDTYV